MSLNFPRLRSIISVTAIVLAGFSPSYAQEVRVETQQQTRAREQNLRRDQGESEQVADPELGDINLVSRQNRPKMFTFFTSQSLNYTTNAFLVRDGEMSDFFWNGRIGASFVPYATRNFTPRVSFDQNWFRYSDIGHLDFDSQNLQFDVKYDLNRNDTWFVTGSYALSRLYEPHSDVGEFYRYGFLNGSVTHLLQLGDTPIALAITGGAYWRHGDPSASDRVSGYLNVAGVYNVCEHVQISAFTRPEFQHYTHDALGDREDFNLAVGAAVSWTPRDYLVIAATASYVGNWSSIDIRDYQVATPSLVFGAQITF
jgi:hypothetical protein